MKISILLSLLILTSCTSYVRTLGNRMISPESQGSLGKGSFEIRAHQSKRDQLNFENDSTTNNVQRAGSPYAAGLMGELGLLNRLDIYLIPSTVSSTIYGLKFQFLGKPESEAKKGNFSTSLVLGYGSFSDETNGNNDLEDFFEGNVEDLEVDTTHQDVGLIVGYRWAEKFLQYANAIYLRETVEGKVTSDSGTLDNAKFTFYQDGMIYSTGFIIYFGTSHLKLDYSHFVSDWSRTEKTTVNTANFALGFNW